MECGEEKEGGGEQNWKKKKNCGKCLWLIPLLDHSSLTTHRPPNQTGIEIPLKPAEHFPVRRLVKDTEEHFDCVIYV